MSANEDPIQLTGCPVPCFTTPMTEHLLMFWGSFQNNDLASRLLGLEPAKESYRLWFESPQDRATVQTHIKVLADQHNTIVAFDCEDGPACLYQTSVSMLLCYEGKETPYTHNFGYGYSDRGAFYMWNEGNYACDCNRSLFLRRIGVEMPELGCGDLIELKDFKISHLP